MVGDMLAVAGTTGKPAGPRGGNTIRAEPVFMDMRGQTTNVDVSLTTELNAVLADLARLTLRALSASPAARNAIPHELLVRLLALTDADAGALLVMPSASLDGRVPDGVARVTDVRRPVLALAGMSAAELESGLARTAGQAPRLIEDDARHGWMALRLPLDPAEGAIQADGHAAEAHVPAEEATLVLRWAAGPSRDTLAARARRLVPQIAEAAGAVVLAAQHEHTNSPALEPAPRVDGRETLAQELEASHRYWEETFDAVSDPISVVDTNYQLVHANAAYVRLFGSSRSECEGHSCFTVAHLGSEPCSHCPLGHTVRSRRPSHEQQELLLADGPNGALQRHVFQRWTYPVVNADGVVERVVEIMKDVTEQERLQRAMSQAEALREADRLKAELLGTVSHELRSPLTSIKGYAGTLLRREKQLPREERHEFLLAIIEASDRLQLIIDRLLEMSQLETGAVTLRLSRVDPAYVAGQAIAAARRMIEERKQEHYTFSLRQLDAHGKPTAILPPVLADATRLRQVLDSLLENAIKYSPGGGPIEIIIKTVPPIRRRKGHAAADTAASGTEHEAIVPAPRGPMVEILVRDHGVGIPSDHLGQIFERFHRVDVRLTREVDGLGLGLAICKRIVDLHGGKIWVESEPGKGSTFHVALPQDGDIE
jgi:PAS domain S-box-containing protein